MFAGLSAHGIQAHDLGELVPERGKDPAYQVSRYDRHPSPLTYGILAEYVVSELLQFRSPFVEPAVAPGSVSTVEAMRR